MVMKDSQEMLAWLLAGEEHPYLQTEAEYLEARAALEASPALQREFATQKAFLDKHPRLIGFDRMPEDVRLRIGYQLKQAQATLEPREVLPPWTVRRQFAWAAVLALFLAGMSVVSTTIIDRRYQAPAPSQGGVLAQPMPQRTESFHTFVTHKLSEGVHLQHEAPATAELIYWIGAHDGLVPELPEALALADGMGCAVVEGPYGRVSLICVNVDGQMFHLFVGCAKALRREPMALRRLQLHDRPALEWVNENHSFLLAPDQPGIELPEILL